MTVNNLSWKISYTLGRSVASATALPVVLDGDYFVVTGTTDIETIDTLSVGMQIILHFDSILTLIQSPMLGLPGGENYETSPGDELRFIEYAPGQWRILNTGSSGGGGGDSISFLRNMDPSYRNMIVGRPSTGRYLTVGEDNIAIGDNALASVTTGSRNIAIGSDTLTASNTLFNVAIGDGALKDSVGTGATAIGYNTLHALVSGHGNVAVGAYVLEKLTTGSYNTALGYQSSIKLETASDNSAFGYQTMLNNVSGKDNSAFGYLALSNNISGHYNSAFGYQALLNSIDDRNTAFGYNALTDCTSGGYNTACGQQALSNVTTGDYNVGLGRNAGATLNGGGGAALLTTSTFIGAHSTALNGADTNSIVIGYEAEGKGSNTAVLGNDDITQTYLKGITNLDDTGQIKFPETANPSADPNILDDYEEGTWEPTAVGGSQGGWNLDPEFNTARYVKTGSTVFVNARLKAETSYGLAEGAIRISLPFTAATAIKSAYYQMGTVMFYQNYNGVWDVRGRILEGNAYFDMIYISSTTNEHLITDIRLLQGSFYVAFGFTYVV